MASVLTSNNDWVAKFYNVIMPKIYGIGAAIVITGAMFKLLNWSGGGLMLGLGLTTEALIFFLSAFEPQAKELDWTKIYPELLEGYEGTSPPRSQPINALGEKLDAMFVQAKIDAALIQRLGQGMQRLTDSVTQIANLSNAAEATARYAVNVEKASEVLENMHEAHASALGAIHKLADVSQNTQHYHEQIQNLTETLNALNTTCKRELQEAQLRSEITKEVYTNIAESMNKMQEAGDETGRFKLELSKLSEKIASLNSVYGNMLTALKS